MSAFFSRYRISSRAKTLATALGLLAIAGFTTHKAGSRHVNGVTVNINDAETHSFVSATQINEVIAAMDNGITGGTVSSINTRAIESRLRENPFIKDVLVTHDNTGKIIVDVQQVNPIARLLRPNGKDVFIDADGKVVPLSPNYSPRVLTVAGAGNQALLYKNMDEHPDALALFALLKEISGHEFWQKMIAGMEVNANGDITMYPQIGKQVISFGNAENAEAKFTKLLAFYKQIIPSKGWNRYSHVSVKYHNQIICE